MQSEIIPLRSERHHGTEKVVPPPFADFDKVGDLDLVGEVGLPAPADKSFALPVADMLAQLPDNESEDPLWGSIGIEEALLKVSGRPPDGGPETPPLFRVIQNHGQPATKL